MVDYSKCRKIIEDQLSQIAINAHPKELYEPIHYILNLGGKRLRPCLTLMAHNLFSDNIDPAIYPALGIEVFHNFTLMHDDIMDNASVRRNHETVHKKWDQNAAILSGDAMMILAYDLISKTKKEHLTNVFRLFNKTALEVCEGQQYDMNFEKINKVSTEDYILMIRLKTAVLFAASLAIGGITAGTDQDNIDNLYNFGLNIGQGFQLQDDYLDVFATHSGFGKEIGGDIVANKKTYLSVLALNHQDKKLAKKVQYWFENSSVDHNEKIERVKEIYIKLGLDEITKKESEYHFDQGLKYLSKINTEIKNKDLLTNLVTKMAHRES